MQFKFAPFSASGKEKIQKEKEEEEGTTIDDH